jgi:hypothetical protein
MARSSDPLSTDGVAVDLRSARVTGSVHRSRKTHSGSSAIGTASPPRKARTRHHAATRSDHRLIPRLIGLGGTSSARRFRCAGGIRARSPSERSRSTRGTRRNGTSPAGIRTAFRAASCPASRCKCRVRSGADPGARSSDTSAATARRPRTERQRDGRTICVIRARVWRSVQARMSLGCRGCWAISIRASLFGSTPICSTVTSMRWPSIWTRKSRLVSKACPKSQSTDAARAAFLPSSCADAAGIKCVRGGT